MGGHSLFYTVVRNKMHKGYVVHFSHSLLIPWVLSKPRTGPVGTVALWESVVREITGQDGEKGAVFSLFLVPKNGEVRLI